MNQFSSPIRISLNPDEKPSPGFWLPDAGRFVSPLLQGPRFLPEEIPDTRRVGVEIRTSDEKKATNAMHFFIRNEEPLMLLSYSGARLTHNLIEEDRLAIFNSQQPSKVSWLRYDKGYLSVNLLESGAYAEDFIGWTQFLLHSFDNAPVLQRRVTPRASRSTPEMALHNALQHIGCYGGASNDPERAEYVRKWVAGRFKFAQGYSYRYRMNTQTKARRPVIEPTATPLPEDLLPAFSVHAPEAELVQT